MPTSKGRIIILSGPSGSGKTTLYQKLIKDKIFYGRIVKSVSVTTRPRRPGEKPGKDYIFLLRKDFLNKKKAGHFLESQKVFDSYYGTPRENVERMLTKGKHVLLCIDVKGARVVARQYPEALKIFVNAPDIETLKKRLQQRGTENFKDMALRLAIARKELKEAKRYDYVVVNDELSQAYQTLKKILQSVLLK